MLLRHVGLYSYISCLFIMYAGETYVLLLKQLRMQNGMRQNHFAFEILIKK